MGSLTVFAAAQRALVLVALIWLLQRYVVPFIVAMAFADSAAPRAIVPAQAPTTED